MKRDSFCPQGKRLPRFDQDTIYRIVPTRKTSAGARRKAERLRSCGRDFPFSYGTTPSCSRQLRKAGLSGREESSRWRASLGHLGHLAAHSALPYDPSSSSSVPITSLASSSRAPTWTCQADQSVSMCGQIPSSRSQSRWQIVRL